MTANYMHLFMLPANQEMVILLTSLPMKTTLILHQFLSMESYENVQSLTLLASLNLQER